jgi:hypothetical protein
LSVNGQATERIGFDLARFGAQLAPRDRPVLIGIETDGDVEVAQRDIPLPVDPAIGTDLDS